MERSVDFFYGIGSRYSYLASTQMPALERDTGCDVRWRPLYSSALMLKRGMDPFRQASPPSGQYDWAYRRYDALCWAAYYGVPYTEPSGGITEYERCALACVAADRLEHCKTFSQALFAAVFTEGRNAIADDDLRRIADRTGLDGDALLRTIDEPETAAVHDRNVTDALAAGAFGVPTFVSGGRLFWGNDRLILLKDFLSGGDGYPTP